MARPKKVTEEVPQDATQDVSIVKVTPVYGAMHHPFQNTRIEGETLVEMDSWVECQIEAGKLTVQG